MVAGKNRKILHRITNWIKRWHLSRSHAYSGPVLNMAPYSKIQGEHGWLYFCLADLNFIESLISRDVVNCYIKAVSCISKISDIRPCFLTGII